MWFRDFHVDALRLDAVHAIKDFGPRHFLAELSENVEKLNAKTGRNHLLIGECDLNDVRYIDSVKKRGYGLDAQWCDEFHHALHAIATGEKLEYYADFGSIEQIAKTIKDAYVYDGIYSPHRKKVFGTKVGKRSGDQFVVFIQNHDQVGNRMLGERIITLVDFEMIKLLAGVMFLSPYIPLIFMGEEYGEKNPFLYFNSHTDPELIKMIRIGRKNEFKEFYNTGEPADPQDEDTFYKSKLSWNFLPDGAEPKLLGYYKFWIRLRKEHAILKSRDRGNITVRVVRHKKIILVERTINKHRLIGILNFEDQPEKVSFKEVKTSGMKLILDSASTVWGGPLPEDRISEIFPDYLSVHGHSMIVYAN
jgi:maltooligosyltrehalose trehalohydrolase